jgi:hypothetical protein
VTNVPEYLQGGGGDETIKMKEGTRERNGKMRNYSAPEGKVDV